MLRETARVRGQAFASFSPDGALLATGDGSDILLYQAVSLERVATLSGHKGPVHSASFSPAGRRLASAGLDHAVRVWDVAAEKEIAELRGHPDNVYAVTFSPDGSRIVSGSNDRTIRVWDARTFEDVVVLAGHQAYVYSLAFSPDGRRLVSGSGDFTVRIWETDPLSVRVQAQRERRVMMEQAAPIVDALLTRLGTASAVVAELRAKETLSPRFRELALQILLGRTARLEATPSQAPRAGS